ncbi:hypothetical protein MMC10_007588 [Thelotrema lepadinum]|nr:hypothetical protein [Thelotrema lepadinum]
MALPAGVPLSILTGHHSHSHRMHNHHTRHHHDVGAQAFLQASSTHHTSHHHPLHHAPHHPPHHAHPPERALNPPFPEQPLSRGEVPDARPLEAPERLPEGHEREKRHSSPKASSSGRLSKYGCRHTGHRKGFFSTIGIIMAGKEDEYRYCETCNDFYEGE